ncbi:MAG: MASE1 domain-containing protein [Gammaproteobacteria bacterium]|nr:MASE1 domain-containing protein [Gammaproteobacteria bacterium]
MRLPPPIRTLMIVLGFALLHIACVALSLSFMMKNTHTVLLWVPNGVAFAMCYVFGYRRVLLGVLLGASVAAGGMVFHEQGVSWSSALAVFILAVTEVIKIGVGVYLIKRFVRSPQLWDRFRDVATFILIALVVCFGASLCNLLFSILVVKTHTFENFGTNFAVWFFADFTSLIVLMPFISVWFTSLKAPIKRENAYEYAALITITLALGYLHFGGHFLNEFFNQYPLEFVVLGAWAIVRFQHRELFLVTFLTSIAMLVGTSAGYGPFIHTDAYQSIFSAHFFTGFITVVTYFVAAISYEHKQKSRELLVLNTSLEQRVLERTQQLVSVNEQLTVEVDTRARKILDIALLQDIAAAANDATRAEKVIPIVLERIGVYAGWSLGHVYILIDAESDARMQPLSVWYAATDHDYNDFKEMHQHIVYRCGEDLVGSVWQEEKPSWNNLWSKSDKRAQQAISVGLSSVFLFPVLAGNRVVAIVEYFTVGDQQPDEALLNIVAQTGLLLGRVFERHLANEERAILNSQLVKTSRQAGMSEIASGVLHNVGNVLNSVNVSVSVASDKVRELNAAGIEKVRSMLSENAGHLDEFFKEPTKLPKLLAYMEMLHNSFIGQREVALEELRAVADNIEHIKSIVYRQQNYAKTMSVLEPVLINDLVEDALEMNAPKLERSYIEVQKDYGEFPALMADRHDILQIVGNLISNAKHAMDGVSSSIKKIVLRTRLIDGNWIRIEVQDTGCGIPQHIQEKLFQFGFTTKKDGHGFGLHACANTAKALGGKLYFESAGEGLGACFILELPYVPLDKASSETA